MAGTLERARSQGGARRASGHPARELPVVARPIWPGGGIAARLDEVVPVAVYRRRATRIAAGERDRTLRPRPLQRRCWRPRAFLGQRKRVGLKGSPPRALFDKNRLGRASSCCTATTSEHGCTTSIARIAPAGIMLTPKQPGFGSGDLVRVNGKQAATRDTGEDC